MARVLFVSLLLLSLPCIFAHTYLSSLVIDGNALPEGTCVRPHPSTAFDYPIPLVTQADMTCGWLPEAARPADRKCAIAAGSTIGLQWYHNSPGPQDDIIASTHLGPCLVYLAKSDTGAGAVWFKIFEDGYDASTKTWCVNKLINNRGLLNVPLPSDIAPGNYLLRGEVIALHGANVVNGVQPYVGCAELTISGAGSANPPGVAIPGVYSPTDPGMFFDLYKSYSSYPIPGPAVYKSGSAPTQSSAAPISSATTTPTIAGTTAPTSQATTAPTSAPTQKATSAPTSAAGSAATSRIQLYPSSSLWWIAVTTRDTPSIASIQFKDSGSYSTYTAMQSTNWGYYTYGATDGKSFVLPISIRLLAADGSIADLPNVFTSWTETTFKTVTTSFARQALARTTPQQVMNEAAAVEEKQEVVDVPSQGDAPADHDKDKSTDSVPSAPTQNVTSPPIIVAGQTAPTVAPSTSVKVTMHEGSSEWWLAVQVSNSNMEIEYVELRDSSPNAGWSALEMKDWKYWVYQTSGHPLVAPLAFRLTVKNGRSVTFLVDEIIPSTLIDTRVQFL